MTLQGLTGQVVRQLATVMLHFKGPTTEYDYKAKKKLSRYVSEMVFPEFPIASEAQREWSATDEEIVQSLRRSAEHAKQFAWFANIEDEHVFVTVVDAGNLRLTVDIDAGEARIGQGWDVSRQPTVIVPITRQNIINLEQILSNGELTYEELYRIVYVLALPAARAMYSIPLLRERGDKSWIGMDDFVQIEIPPQEQVLYDGRAIRIEMTIVNVDGQWLVMEGLRGDPDARFTLTIDDAVQWYRFSVYDVRKASGTRELVDLARRVADVTQRTMTYLRADHR
jgi:hypothetical protein